MKLRLFPHQEDAYFGLFQAAADTIAAAATALLDLLTDLVDPETKAKQLAQLEHEGDQLHRRVRPAVRLHHRASCPAHAALEGHYRRHRAGPGRAGHVAHTVEGIVLKHA